MSIDYKRRQAVMSRSRKLGHCICNPSHPCPCPVFLEQNICPCAGEKPTALQQTARLTRHVRKAGCASKIGQADLQRILGALPQFEDPRVLLGTAAGDDAGVYQLDDRTALVQTVDVFTPCVDDPFLFGQIAAANSVSDVYAMGGRPITALSIIGFPIDELDGAIMQAILEGGLAKLDEADCRLIGGHSINDEEIKCGFAVTGLIDPKLPVFRDRAQPGDLLILTKPLGTGIVSFAAQLGRISEECLAEVGHWMAALNRDAAECMIACGAHACTDITGFGLAGHLLSMARGSRVNIDLDLEQLPVFGVVPECIRQDVYGGAVDRNQAFAMHAVAPGAEVPEALLPILYDAQTSGGLLIALPEGQAQRFQAMMQERGLEVCPIIGKVTALEPGMNEGLIRVHGKAFRNLIGLAAGLLSQEEARPSDTVPEASAEPPAAHLDEACCCGSFEWESPPSPASIAEKPAPELEESTSSSPMETLKSFQAFMKAANEPGLIDARNKKLMAVCLSIAHHCEPCLKAHLESALEMGLSREELDEAANLAIAFGGCTSMMFYRETLMKILAQTPR